MGQSRGGLTSKINAVVDTKGLPIRLALPMGEAHDNRLEGKLLSRIKSGTMLLAAVAMKPTGSEPLAPRGAFGPTSRQSESQRADLLQPISLPRPEFCRAGLQ
jgi:hypothetical protein